MQINYKAMTFEDYGIYDGAIIFLEIKFEGNWINSKMNVLFFITYYNETIYSIVRRFAKVLRVII